MTAEEEEEEKEEEEAAAYFCAVEAGEGLLPMERNSTGFYVFLFIYKICVTSSTKITDNQQQRDFDRKIVFIWANSSAP